jgi:hypothetical protein
MNQAVDLGRPTQKEVFKKPKSFHGQGAKVRMTMSITSFDSFVSWKKGRKCFLKSFRGIFAGPSGF